jgi:hypothetical protein
MSTLSPWGSSPRSSQIVSYGFGRYATSQKTCPVFCFLFLLFSLLSARSSWPCPNELGHVLLAGCSAHLRTLNRELRIFRWFVYFSVLPAPAWMRRKYIGVGPETSSVLAPGIMPATPLQTVAVFVRWTLFRRHFRTRYTHGRYTDDAMTKKKQPCVNNPDSWYVI